MYGVAESSFNAVRSRVTSSIVSASLSLMVWCTLCLGVLASPVPLYGVSSSPILMVLWSSVCVVRSSSLSSSVSSSLSLIVRCLLSLQLLSVYFLLWSVTYCFVFLLYVVRERDSVSLHFFVSKSQCAASHVLALSCLVPLYDVILLFCLTFTVIVRE